VIDAVVVFQGNKNAYECPAADSKGGDPRERKTTCLNRSKLEQGGTRGSSGKRLL